MTVSSKREINPVSGFFFNHIIYFQFLNNFQIISVVGQKITEILTNTMLQGKSIMLCLTAHDPQSHLQSNAK